MKIEVSVSRQTLRLLEGDAVLVEYPISTSKFGLGVEEGSNRTPLGNFTVAEKHGDSEPRGTKFVGRVPVGVWSPEEVTEEDMVLSRILWLDGADPDNLNTKERYIYIHGTNQEHLIGQPASHGCIRMKNADVEDLYGRVSEGVPVRIVE